MASLKGPATIEGYHVADVDQVEHPAPRPVRADNDHRLRKTRGPIDVYAEALDLCGLDDPFGAVAKYRHARELRRTRPAAVVPRPAVAAADVVKLASGKATVDKVTVEHVEVDPDAERRDHRARRRALDQAAALAWTEALNALHEAGDEILDLFRPTIDRCLANPNDRQLGFVWDAVHDALDELRPWAVPGAAHAAPRDYRFARPDLVHRWTLAQSRGVRLISVEEERIDGHLVRRLFNAPKTPQPVPLWVIGEHADEWQPGLYTAVQVVEHAAVFAPPSIEAHLELVARQRAEARA